MSQQFSPQQIQQLQLQNMLRQQQQQQQQPGIQQGQAIMGQQPQASFQPPQIQPSQPAAQGGPTMQSLPIRAYLDQTVVPILLDGKWKEETFVPEMQILHTKYLLSFVFRLITPVLVHF